MSTETPHCRAPGGESSQRSAPCRIASSETPHSLEALEVDHSRAASMAAPAPETHSPANARFHRPVPAILARNAMAIAPSVPGFNLR
jgi:hypothetical protein